MNRIQGDQAKGRVERYSRNNLPSDEPTAQERIDKLNVDVEIIQTRLDYADPDTFRDSDEYKIWRNKTTAALGYIRQELKFLDYWLKEQRRLAEVEKAKSSGVRSPNNDIQIIAQDICHHARQLADEIKASYTVCFTVDNQPENIDTAQERLSYLGDVKERLQGAFAEIAAQWTSYPLRRDGISRAKAPLHVVLRKVEQEIKIVKNYIRSNHPGVDVKVVFMRAIERALAEGFVLTPEEEVVLAQFKSQKR